MVSKLAPFTAPARAWFLAEVAFLAERNPASATKVIAQFQVARRMLAEHPDIARPGPTPGLRRFVAGPYVLTVRRMANTVEILSIRHGRQTDKKE